METKGFLNVFAINSKILYHKKRYERIDRMKTRLMETPLKDLTVVEIDCFQDERGFIIEPWHKRDFQKAGLDLTFVQEVHSKSKYKVLRGLHFQNMKAPIEKLIRCICGNAFCVAVDLRIKSTTFGKWFDIELSAENKKQLFVPVGFAFGFIVVSDFAELLYKFTGFYEPSAERILLWNDKDLSIPWPYGDPILSKKDLHGMTLQEYRKNPSFA